MIIKTDLELDRFKESGKICAYIRDKTVEYIKPGMSTLEADKYAGTLFKETGFISAPKEIYSFPGNICVSVNSCVAHGVPSADIIIKDGDSVNIDVCGHLGGIYTDCGKSIVVGKNEARQSVCSCAKDMLYKGLKTATHGALFNRMGKEMETVCKAAGFYPIKKLTGHGIGTTLHEKPKHIHCHYISWDRRKFQKGMAVAIETFVSSKKQGIYMGDDGWSCIVPFNAYTAQFEHTIVITEDEPIILTEQHND